MAKHAAPSRDLSKIEVSDLVGLHVGSLGPDGLEAFNQACANGRAFRSYTGAGGLMGLAKVAVKPPSRALSGKTLSSEPITTDRSGGAADLRTFDVEVIQTVRVTLDASKFTPAFMAEFQRTITPLFDLEEHAEYLADLAARGVAELNSHVPDEFVEGYGPIGDMGISAEVMECEVDIVS